jgi:hypothetical protein
MACGPKKLFVLISTVFLLTTLAEADRNRREPDYNNDDEDSGQDFRGDVGEKESRYERESSMPSDRADRRQARMEANTVG